MHVGERITRARESAELNLSDLSRSIGVDRSTVRRWDNERFI